MADNSSDGIKIIALNDKPAETAGAGISILSATPGAAAATIPGAPTAATSGGPAAVATPAPAAAITSESKGPVSFSLGSTPGAISKPADPATAGPAKPGVANDMGSFFNRPTAKSNEPKLLESLVTQKAMADKSKPILGNAPALQKALEQEKEMQQKRRLRVVQIMFLTVFVAAGLMALYFYTELSPSFNLFGQNTTARLADYNQKLINVQTELNKDRYLAAQIELNQLSFVTDQFFDATAKMSAEGVTAIDKQDYELTATEAAGKIPGIVQRIRELLQESLVVPTIRSEAEEEQTPDVILQKATDDLRTALTNYKNGLVSTASTDIANNQEIRLTDNAIKLVGNTDILTKVQAISTDQLKKELEDYIADLDPVKRTTLQGVISGILATTTSDIATITSIKNQRVDWLNVIKQIEEETKKVDTSYDPNNKNREIIIKSQGGVNYTGFNFDSANKSVSIIGTYKTLDASNFTRISELIDTFNKVFKNVEMRSFAKSSGSENGYDASFTLKLELMTDPQEVSNQNKISLVKKIMAQKAMRKRLLSQ